MGTLAIELAPELEDRLRAAARSEGLELREYIIRALEAMASVPHPDAGRSTGAAILEIFAEAVHQIPLEERAKSPGDLAENHDHYPYGALRRS